MYRQYFDRSSSEFSSYNPSKRVKEVKNLVLSHKHHDAIDEFVTYYLNRPSGFNLDYVHKKLAYAILKIAKEILEYENNIKSYEAEKLLAKIKLSNFSKNFDFDDIKRFGNNHIGSYILLLEIVIEETEDV